MRNNIKIKASICNWIRDDVCCSLRLKRETGVDSFKCRKKKKKKKGKRTKKESERILETWYRGADSSVFHCSAAGWKKKKQPCVKYTRIPLFRNTHITDSHQNILLILCSKNTVVMIQFQTTIIYSSVGEEGEIKTNCTLKAQLYKLTWEVPLA